MRLEKLERMDLREAQDIQDVTVTLEDKETLPMEPLERTVPRERWGLLD